MCRENFFLKKIGHYLAKIWTKVCGFLGVGGATQCIVLSILPQLSSSVCPVTFELCSAF